LIDLLLHWAHLWSSTLRGSVLDLLDDFFSTIGCISEFVFNLGLFAVYLLLLSSLDAFDFLLMFLIISLCFLLGVFSR